LYVFGIVVVAMSMWGVRSGEVRAAGDEEAARPQFYTTKVQPIFEANCYRCHGWLNHRGGLSLSTRVGVMKGGKDGVVVVPGDPAASLLVKLIRHEGPSNDPGQMPPKSKLSDADIATVERWVRAGAVMPADVTPQ
jgi:mono/diheme cytochrome c family protein